MNLSKDVLTQEEGPVLLEEGDALLQVLAAQAPPVVEAVQRIQPGDQDQVQGLACKEGARVTMHDTRSSIMTPFRPCSVITTNMVAMLAY